MKHVILGSGIAGIAAGEELRKGDPGADITIVADEEYYFRAALSKYFQGAIEKDEVWGKPDGWYEDNGIEFRRERAVRIDTPASLVECDSGARVGYDRLLIATGAEPFVMDWPGLDLEGVCTYRGLGCVEKFLRFVDRGAKRAVVIGGGILSFELIENFLKLGLEVVFVVRGERLLNLLFDEKTAAIMTRHLADAGVDIRFNTEAREFTGVDGNVTGIVTKDGGRIECDIVAAAVGIKPDKSLFEGSGIDFDRAVLVDRHLRTSADNVYAAGDCCAVGHAESGYAPTRTWLTSALQGRTAARNMLGGSEVFEEGVFFNASHVFTSFYAVMGEFNPRDPKGYEFKSWQFAEDSHMRWTLKGGRLVGAIVLNAARYIWPTRQLIEAGADVTRLVEGELTVEGLQLLVPQESQVLF
jgi:NAD(P)H-nitrite reductase large subunit